MHINTFFRERVPRFTRLSKGPVARKEFKNPWCRHWLLPSTPPEVILLSEISWITGDTGTGFSGGFRRCTAHKPADRPAHYHILVTWHLAGHLVFYLRTVPVVERWGGY